MKRYLVYKCTYLNLTMAKNYQKQIFLTIFRYETKVPGISVKIFKYILMKLNKFIGTTGFSHKMINFHKWQGFNVGLMDHYGALTF